MSIAPLLSSIFFCKFLLPFITRKCYSMPAATIPLFAINKLITTLLHP